MKQHISSPDGLLLNSVPDYSLHETNSIIVRLPNRSYFLEGLNAVVFTDLCRDPIFHGQLPSDWTVEKRKKLIETLTVALATIDRDQSEPATKAVIRALWLKEKQSGISRFVDRLAQRQWKDSKWEGYRDHLNHMLKVYLLGLFLYKNCHTLRNRLLSAAKCSDEEFRRRWLYASTFHDVGYIFELPDPQRVEESLKFIQDYVNNFLHYHDQELSEDIQSAGLKPATIESKHSKDILSVMGLYLRDLKSTDDLETIWGSQNILTSLDHLCQGAGLGEHGLSTYYRLCLTQSPPMSNGREPFYDHGIMSAMMLLYVGYAQTTIFDKLRAGLNKGPNGEPAQLEASGRTGVLRKMVEWAVPSAEFRATIEQAAAAVALHNVYKTAWKFEDLPWQLDLANYWVSLDDNPLAFFLIMNDILQDWDRPGFNPRSQEIHSPLSANDIDIRCDETKISLGYSNRPPDEFTSTIKELQSVLLPNQVDAIIAPLDTKYLPWSVLPSPGYVERNAEQLIMRLRGEWFERFINLYLLPLKLAQESASTPTKQFTVFELAEQFMRTPIAVLGEPGAGKTTLVKRVAIEYAEKKGPKIPVFIDMRTFSDPDDLNKAFDFVPEASLRADLLGTGRFLIVFDGFNEVSLELREPAARAIASFLDKFPENQFILTCRTAEYPPVLRPRFREFRVLPLSLESGKEYLVQRLGPDSGEAVYASLPLRVRELCQNPLLLTMLTYLYTGKMAPKEVPSSKAALYEEFLRQLYAREEELRSIELTQTIREDFLCALAFRLENKSTAIDRGTAEQSITEYYRSHYLGTGVNLVTVTREVLTLPPMRASAPGKALNIDVGFMHQSFQEYYTARALQRIMMQDAAGINKVLEYATPSNEHWWETLSLLVGLVENATPIITGIKKNADKIATDQGDQRVFTLVARCIREAKHIDPSEVDDVIVRTLLAFKFGKVAFDYELIHGLRLIRPDQRSTDFPSRLMEDVNWWLGKYARVSPVRLDPKLPIKTLLEYLESEDTGLAVDALFTMCRHQDRSKAVDPLIQKLQNSSGNVREQIIATLGYCETYAKGAVPALIAVVNDPRETKWARAYALNALGKIGDSQAAPAMIDYMLNHENPYRDSASWGLQSIAKNNPSDTELKARLKEAYLQALLAESSDKEGRYAKGNIVYSLGELGATEHAERISQWLRGESDPYVLEDGIQALGQLRNPNSRDIIVHHLSDEDPVVRMMAADAIVNLSSVFEHSIDIYALLEPLLSDKAAIVREHVQKATQVKPCAS